MTCPICTAYNEDILLQTPNLRVIAVHNEASAPAFCRVIWNSHIAEMTDLSAAERAEIMEMVYKVEAAMRQVFRQNQPCQPGQRRPPSALARHRPL